MLLNLYDKKFQFFNINIGIMLLSRLFFHTKISFYNRNRINCRLYQILTISKLTIEKEKQH